MSALRLVPENLHRLQVDGRRVLLHVPTTAVFELDELSGTILDQFSAGAVLEASELGHRVDDRFDAADVTETLDELVRMDLLRGLDTEAAVPAPVTIRDYPLSTLVLNVSTGCNLACHYCYKEDLTKPSSAVRMELETAQRGVDLLLAQAAERSRVNLVFFGGEPLLALDLIRATVDYAETRCAENGTALDLSLTTNATLLNEATIDWLDSHRFGLTVSIDGPEAAHDRHRRTVGGHGTHATVSEKVRTLLARYRSRPVGARVTLAAGNTDVVAIHRHLREELGFFEVGFAPVTAADDARLKLDDAGLATVFAGLRELGQEYLAAALRDQNNGFANMHQIITDLHEGTRKVLPCGAGLGMLAVDGGGDLHLCHRFVGSTLPSFGSVDNGIDRDRLGQFLESAVTRDDSDCTSCRIRHLCAGGCYHEAYARHGDPLRPTDHYCTLMRDWIDLGLDVYARIIDNNPDFLVRHVAPRRGLS